METTAKQSKWMEKLKALISEAKEDGVVIQPELQAGAGGIIPMIGIREITNQESDASTQDKA